MLSHFQLPSYFPQIDDDKEESKKKFSLTTKVLFFSCIGLIVWCFLIGGFIELFVYIGFILPLTIPCTIISAVKDKAKIRYTVATKIFFIGMMLFLGIGLYGTFDYLIINTEYSGEILFLGTFCFLTFSLVTLILALRDRPTAEDIFRS
jgi:hypothetical protein